MSSLFFEIALFITRKFPDHKDQVFRNQNGVYNGLSETRFINMLRSMLENNGKVSSYEANDFVKFMRLLLLYRTLSDHFGGFKEELMAHNFHRIRVFEGEMVVSGASIPHELSREELVKVLAEAERWLEFLWRLLP